MITGSNGAKTAFLLLRSRKEASKTFIGARSKKPPPSIIKASKKSAREQRKHQGGYLEFGYSKDENGKLIPNEKEFVILQSMFNLRKSGLGYRKISDEIKKKFGRTIYFPQVHKIMNREHNQRTFGVVA